MVTSQQEPGKVEATAASDTRAYCRLGLAGASSGTCLGIEAHALFLKRNFSEPGRTGGDGALPEALWRENFYQSRESGSGIGRCAGACVRCRFWNATAEEPGAMLARRGTRGSA